MTFLLCCTLNIGVCVLHALPNRFFGQLVIALDRVAFGCQKVVGIVANQLEIVIFHAHIAEPSLFFNGHHLFGQIRCCIIWPEILAHITVVVVVKNIHFSDKKKEQTKTNFNLKYLNGFVNQLVEW